MLSILIPTYNYNCFSLVELLYNQCIKAGIEFEIICQDDASNSVLNVENIKINQFNNCTFSVNQTNLGRAGNINSLINQSTYSYFLILDCDVFPKNKNFILNYCKQISLQKKYSFGGIVYENKIPNKNQMLRWKYGKKREAINCIKRKSMPLQYILTSNILIRKEPQKKYFDDEITSYGYEDLVFIKNNILTKNDIDHIDNVVYHLNIENSIDFLNKTKIAMENLKELISKNKLNYNATSLTKVYRFLVISKVAFLFRYFFDKTRTKIETHLKSSNPYLFIFDFYKLGYFISINNK
jgi:hypothetical protein